MADDEFGELIDRAKDGDRNAFEQLVQGTYQRVHRLAVRMMGNIHDADDVVQESYVRAYRALKKFRGDARFSTWMHRIVSNTASTKLLKRSKNRHTTLEETDELVELQRDVNPEFVTENNHVGARLKRSLDALPERLRSVVVLRDLHGFSHSEIAKRLNISEATSKVRLHRARNRMRDGLKAWWGLARSQGSSGDKDSKDRDKAPEEDE